MNCDEETCTRTTYCHSKCDEGVESAGEDVCIKPNLEYLYRRVATTHDLNAILYPPSSENTVRCIAV